MNSIAEQILIGIFAGALMSAFGSIVTIRDHAMALEFSLFFQILCSLFIFFPLLPLNVLLEIYTKYTRGFAKVIFDITILGIIYVFCKIVYNYLYYVFSDKILLFCSYSMYFLALPLANLLIKKKYHQESGFARHSVFWFVFAMFVIGFLGFRIPFWICSMVE